MAQVLGLLGLVVVASASTAAVVAYNNTITAVDQKIENRGVDIEDTKGEPGGLATLDELGLLLKNQLTTCVTDHLDNKEIHRVQNDSYYSSTTLWSSSHTKTYADTEIKTQVLDREAQPLGIATLDSLGKLLSDQIPNLALISVCVCANIAARDALTVESGDGAIVIEDSPASDGSGNRQFYIYDGSAWQSVPTNTEVTALLKTLFLVPGDYVHVNEFRIGTTDYVKITKQAGPGTYDWNYPVGAPAINQFLRSADASGNAAWTNYDHASLAGNSIGDDHSQYALLAGRGSGQELVGGTAPSNNLRLTSTSDATKGVVFTNDEFRCDKIDVDSATTFQIGSSLATEVRIAQSGVATLAMGSLRAVEGIASTGVTTNINGPLSANEGLIVTTNGATITAGDLTLTAGNLNMTLGDATLTDGNLTLTDGNIELTEPGATVDGVDLKQLKSDYDTHAGDATVHFTEASIDHGSIAGLGDDDHTQYAKVDGRATGQSIVGGLNASEELVLQGTSHATVGGVRIKDGLRLEEAGVGSLYTEHQRAAGGATHTNIWPNNNGAGVLTNNGSGALSWSAIAGSVYGYAGRAAQNFVWTGGAGTFVTRPLINYDAGVELGTVTYNGPLGQFGIPSGLYKIGLSCSWVASGGYGPTPVEFHIAAGSAGTILPDADVIKRATRTFNVGTSAEEERPVSVWAHYRAAANRNVRFFVRANGSGTITVSDLQVIIERIGA